MTITPSPQNYVCATMKHQGLISAYLIIFGLLGFSPNLAVGQTNRVGGIEYTTRLVPVYTFHQSSAAQTVLEMDYASSTIKYPRMWTNDVRGKEIYEVDIVFTNYPSNKADWLTNYDTLLNQRVQSVKGLIPELKGKTDVRWNLVLQTDCPTEEAAKERFHGAVVKYRIVLTNKIRQTIKKVRDIVNGQVPFADSVVFRTFDRNKDWQNMLVVNDWTGSMYPYGAQAVLWHRIHLRSNPRIRHFAFFNDGDLLPDELKVVGQTGGIYLTPADSLVQIARTMKQVMISGYGGDDPENDLEAVWEAMQQVESYGQVVLIADNKSGVRDMDLLDTRDFPPIRVVLCGADSGRAIHPDYLEIAQRTEGSIHTIEEDIEALSSSTQEGSTQQIMGMLYWLKNGKWRLKED